MTVLLADLCGALAAWALPILPLRAESRFRERARLPMQWSFPGGPTWSAPRRVALSLVPALATAILATLASLAHTGPEEAADSMTAPRVVMAVTFLAGHILHLHLVAKAR